MRTNKLGNNINNLARVNCPILFRSGGGGGSGSGSGSGSGGGSGGGGKPVSTQLFIRQVGHIYSTGRTYLFDRQDIFIRQAGHIYSTGRTYCSKLIIFCHSIITSNMHILSTLSTFI